MKRVIPFVAMLLLVPALAAAQRVPPTPPIPPPAPEAPPPPPAPVPPAPQAVPVPPVPPIPWPIDVVIPPIDTIALEQALQQAQDKVRLIDMGAIREQALATQKVQLEAARAQMEHAQMDMERMHIAPFVWDGQQMNMTFSQTSSQEGSYYSSGMSSVMNRQFERAITSFDRAIAQKGAHADGALYWKAYSQFKLGKSDDALASIAELRKSHDKSRYLNDAKVLEADIKRTAGQPASVQDAANEDLKMLAIQGLMHSNPEQAIAAAEGVLTGNNAPGLKKQALYVLAGSEQPKAHAILLNYAKGAGNPDLQRQAIEYIANTSNSRKQTTTQELLDIYATTTDVDVKRTILRALGSVGDKTALLKLASGTGIGVTGADAMTLRREAINTLSNLSSPQDIWTLYSKEEEKTLRAEMLRAFGNMGAVDQLNEALKVEKDVELRRQIIRSLGNMRAEKTGAQLVAMYGSETDRENKKAIISALGNQNNAENLIAIARKESDKELAVSIVQKLVNMAGKSKAAADYLMEIIKK